MGALNERQYHLKIFLPFASFQYRVLLSRTYKLGNILLLIIIRHEFHLYRFALFKGLHTYVTRGGGKVCEIGRKTNLFKSVLKGFRFIIFSFSIFFALTRSYRSKMDSKKLIYPLQKTFALF